MAKSPRSPTEAPSVVVLGATVAGLTAAHELARRGFEVSVLVAPGEIPGGSSSQGWTARKRIAPFGKSGRRFHQSAPTPAEVCVDPIPASSRHLLDTLATIPSATKGKHLVDGLVQQPWRPLRRPGSPLPLHPDHVPLDVGEIVDGAKAFADAGYSPPDGHTFVARVLRYLISSPRRRQTECQTVSMLDYLRGANAAAVPMSCEYSQAFITELADLPDPSIGMRPSLTDARTGLGSYVQALMADKGSNGSRHQRFPAGTRQAWFEPWLAHLRDSLGVRFLTGRLARLHAALPTSPRRPRSAATDITARITECSKTTRQLVEQASYLVVATDAALAEKASAKLPPVGVPAELQGFTAGLVAGRKQSRAAGEVAGRRWAQVGGVQLFLPDPLVLEGPIAVVGSAWKLVIRPQLAFRPRLPVRTRDRFGCVLSVDIEAWNEPSPRIGKTALECEARQLAREVWAQIDEAHALRSPGGRRPSPPSWFAVDSRVELAANGRVRSVARRLLCLPGDWASRPGLEPGSGAGTTHGRQKPLWTDGESGGSVHWNRVVFAGDYLKNHTRATGDEAACESGRRAANTIVAHARVLPARAAEVPKLAPIFDPEAREIPALDRLKQLDDWCARERLPHPFELAGVDGWISLVSWFGALYPVSEPFMKTILEKLLALAQVPGRAPKATSSQEAVLEALRKLREALQSQSRRPAG